MFRSPPENYAFLLSQLNQTFSIVQMRIKFTQWKSLFIDGERMWDVKDAHSFLIVITFTLCFQSFEFWAVNSLLWTNRKRDVLHDHLVNVLPEIIIIIIIVWLIFSFHVSNGSVKTNHNALPMPSWSTVNIFPVQL